MYLLGVSPLRSQSHTLERRKGGGGKGAGGSGNKGGSSSSSRPSTSVSGTSGRTASAYNNGDARVSNIPSGQAFAGRQQGGGTRQQIYGTPIYGSGYPGAPVIIGQYHTYGTSGRHFPFFFWPLAWGGVATYAGASYMYNNEYGNSDNSTRPGGIMETAIYPSKSTNATYRVVADHMSIESLISSIAEECSEVLASNSSTSPAVYDKDAASPKPEQVLQYFRGSSLALTMDGYNNTGAAEGSDSPPSPLPPYNDQPLLDCLNSTIGEAAPLIDGANMTMPSLGLLGLVWAFWFASSLF